MTGYLKKKSPYLILAFIILFHLAASFVWLKMDKSFIKFDAWALYRYSLEVFEFLKSALNFKLPFPILEPQRWHGIIVGFVTALFYPALGSSQDTAIMINSAIFFTILALSVYGIAKKLFGIKEGIIAVIILSLYPIIFNNLRIYMLDLALTSAVSLSLYFLIASDDFNDKRNSLLFCLSFWFGLLVKFNFIAFIIGPLAFAIYQALKQKQGFQRNNLKKILYFSVAVAFISMIFYASRLRNILERIYEVSSFSIFKNYNTTFLEFLSWRLSLFLKYLELSIGQGYSFLFLMAFLAGFCIFIRRSPKKKWLLYLVLIVPSLIQILFLSIEPGCLLRYNMPFLPIVAIITSCGLLGINKKALKVPFLSLLIILGVIQFFAVSFGLPLLPEKANLIFRFKGYNFDLVLFRQNLGVPPFLKDKTSHPSSSDWKSSLVLQAIRTSNIPKERVKVIALNYIPEVFEAMEYQILIGRELIDLMPPGAIASPEKFYEKRHAPIDMLSLNSDYIIASNNPDPEWEKLFDSNPSQKEKIENARRIFNQNISHFKLIQTMRLPDGTDLLLYKNTYKPELIKLQGIQRGDIKLLFDSGRIRIFYRGVEITKGLGLYSSLFSLQHFRDSMEATWEIKEKNKTKLVALGRWMFIPIVEIWEIELDEKNVINWRINLSAEDTIKIEVEDFKLMLSDSYKSWFVSGGQKGDFLSFFEKSSWKKFWTGSIENKTGVKGINTGGLFLPSVSIQARDYSKGYAAAIENSDQLFNARVIGFTRKNPLPKNVFNKGESEYFSAQIIIE